MQSLVITLFCIIFLCRGNRSRNLTDLAALVLKYPFSPSLEGPIPLPESCAIVSSSQIQSTVTTSGFLDPGRYAILPLAFNHWMHHSQDTPSTKRGSTGTKERSSKSDNGGARSDGDANSVGYVVALHTGRIVSCHEHVTTRPGFLAESLFLLMKSKGKKSSVSWCEGHAVLVGDMTVGL